jgi:phosphatidylglycerophosphate synthase
LNAVNSLVGWSVAGIVLTALLARMVWRWRGARARPGIADWLTLLRLALIAPTAWLLAHDRYLAAMVCYAFLITTDVADGIVARRRRETTPFGVFLDPLADIISTFAVFTVLAMDGLVPLWLYLLLVVRYLMLGVGSLLLSRSAGPMEFHATLPGKIVGVLQAAAVLWLMHAASQGADAIPGRGPLFAFLGLGFVSIVVSQAIIGYRHIRRARPRARGYDRGSSR